MGGPDDRASGMSPEPIDPIGPLAAMATQLHELLVAYVEAGFTRAEALHLVTALITPGKS